MRPFSKVSKAFTLIEIMIVLAIMGIVVAIAAPTWFRQREQSRAVACQENLFKIYGAEQQYAIEFRLSNGAPMNFPQDLIQPGAAAVGQGYIRSLPECPASGVYDLPAIGQTPTCSIGTTVTGFPPHTFEGRL